MDNRLKLKQHADCPTCKHHATFQHIGIQQTPPELVESTGYPAQMAIWQCQTCGTALLEPNLTFDEKRELAVACAGC